jgi:hypothetical protein
MSRVSEGVLRVSGDTLGGRCKGVLPPIGGHPTYPPSGTAWISPGRPDTLACPTCHRRVSVLRPVECVRCSRMGGPFFPVSTPKRPHQKPGDFLGSALLARKGLSHAD